MLNPVLEEMVAECIHKTPADPVPFMLEWLENKKVQEEDKLLSPEDKDRLVQENEQLQFSVNKVKGQMQEAAKLAISEPAGEEEEEEDEEDDEPPPGFFEQQEQATAGGAPKAR